MGEVMTVDSRLLTGMCFHAQAGSGHSLLMDVEGHAGGQNTGFRPMELLLVGLAGCAGMDVLSILRKKRQHVSEYEIRVRAERAEEHPMVFTEITVEHFVTGHAIDAAAVERAIELAESRYCGAGAMLGKTARIRHTYQIVEAAPGAAADAAVAHSREIA